MYIDPFWAGVLSVVFIELVLLFFGAIILARRGKK
jgi:hypothetical protein